MAVLGDHEDWARQVHDNLNRGEGIVLQFTQILANNYLFMEKAFSKLFELRGIDRGMEMGIETRLLFEGALNSIREADFLAGFWMVDTLRHRGSEMHPFEFDDAWLEEVIELIPANLNDAFNLITHPKRVHGWY